MSVLYSTRSNKKILIVGDLFWSKLDWDYGTEYLDLCVNKERQDKSRAYVKNVLKPDIIIPEHGCAFAPKY